MKTELVAAVVAAALLTAIIVYTPSIQQAVAPPPPPPPPGAQPATPAPTQPPSTAGGQPPPPVGTPRPPCKRMPGSCPCPGVNVTKEHALHDLWESYRMYNVTVQELEKARSTRSLPEKDVSYLLSLYREVYSKARSAYEAGDYTAAAAYAHLSMDVLHALQRVAGLCPSPPRPPGP